MRPTLKEKIEVILQTAETIKFDGANRNLADNDCVEGLTYKAVEDLNVGSNVVVTKDEVLDLDFANQSSKFIIIKKDGKIYPMNKSQIYTSEPVTTTAVDTLISKYKAARNFVDLVESDIILDQLVNDEQIKTIASRLAEMPNYDIDIVKLAIAGLKAEILDVSEADR